VLAQLPKSERRLRSSVYEGLALDNKTLAAETPTTPAQSARAGVAAFEQGMQDARRATQEDPSYAVAWLTPCSMHRISEHHEAVACYDEALRLGMGTEHVSQWRSISESAVADLRRGVHFDAIGEVAVEMYGETQTGRLKEYMKLKHAAQNAQAAAEAAAAAKAAAEQAVRDAAAAHLEAELKQAEDERRAAVLAAEKRERIDEAEARARNSAEGKADFRAKQSAKRAGEFREGAGGRERAGDAAALPGPAARERRATAADQAAEEASVRSACCACGGVSAADATEDSDGRALNVAGQYKGCTACVKHYSTASLEWPRYCSKECQTKHWPQHREVCVSKR